MVRSLARYEVRYYSKGEHSPVQDFLDGLPPKAAAKCLAYVALLAERGFSLPRNYSAKVHGDIWELRPEYGNVEYRLLYAWIAGRFFVIAHAFVKKGRALSPREITIAQERVREIQAFYERSNRSEPR
jgi:phage-related protein